MTDITSAKVAVLTIFNSYWGETAIKNLPANVKIVSAPFDNTIQNPQVVVGPLSNTEDEWISNKSKLFKANVDLHGYVRRLEGNPTHTDMGTMKKQRDAIMLNILEIIKRHPDNPAPGIMHIFPKTRERDADILTQKEIILHSISQAEVWYTEDYQ